MTAARLVLYVALLGHLATQLEAAIDNERRINTLLKGRAS